MAQISYVIPTYNMRDTVSRTIDSCLRNDRDVIVVDDGSTDDTLTYLRSKYSNRITLVGIRNNKGAGHAINYGLVYVETPYFVVCGADDYVTDDNAALWEAQELSDVNYCNLKGFKPINGINFKENITRNIPKSDSFHSCYQFYTDTGRHIVDGAGCLCLKTEVILRNPYDIKLRNKEGGELLLRLALLGYGFRYFEFIGGVRNTIGKSANTEENKKAMKYIIEKLKSLKP